MEPPPFVSCSAEFELHEGELVRFDDFLAHLPKSTEDELDYYDQEEIPELRRSSKSSSVL
eukprot:scaffold13851_cov124-Isochrysis_galbana.AAC.4